MIIHLGKIDSGFVLAYMLKVLFHLYFKGMKAFKNAWLNNAKFLK